MLVTAGYVTTAPCADTGGKVFAWCLSGPSIIFIAVSCMDIRTGKSKLVVLEKLIFNRLKIMKFLKESLSVIRIHCKFSSRFPDSVLDSANKIIYLLFCYYCLFDLWKFYLQNISFLAMSKFPTHSVTQVSYDYLLAWRLLYLTQNFRATELNQIPAPDEIPNTEQRKAKDRESLTIEVRNGLSPCPN